MDDMATPPSALNRGSLGIQSDMKKALSPERCKVSVNIGSVGVGKFKWEVKLLVFLCLLTDRLLTTMPIAIFPKELACDMGDGVVSDSRLGCVSDVSVFIAFASKPIFQTLANVFVGKVVDRLGPWIPLRAALGVMLVSTIGFGIGLFLNDGLVAMNVVYPILVVSRSVQGLASASVMNAGLTLVSRTFTKDERGSAIGFVMTGTALGLLAGPLVGGLLATYWPAWVAFALMASLIAVGIFLQQAVLRGFEAALEISKTTEQQDSQIVRVWSDPFVLIIVFANLAANMIISILEPMVPLYLARSPFSFGPTREGLVWSNAAMSFALCTPLAGYLSDVRPKHVVMASGMAMLAFGTGVTFLQQHVWVTISGLISVGAGMAFIDTTTPSLLIAIAEFRGSGTESYGRYFATQDLATALGFVIGPLAAATTVARDIPFERVTLLPTVFCALGVFAVMFLPWGMRTQPCAKEHEQELAIIRVEEGRPNGAEEGKPQTCNVCDAPTPIFFCSLAER